jgi:cell division protein ZapA
MNRGQPIPVNLRILEKDYVIACPEEERETLIASAQYLNQRVQQVRDGGKIVSTERIVVVSALNIIHEYLQYKQRQENEIQTFDEQIALMQEKIEVALSDIKE